MAPSATPQYNPSGGNSPFMTLPEHVDGFIDLRTLADIHKFLSQSEINDDQQLAKWVKDEYLFEPLSDEGRQIRTTEGFARLDKAYRRVRQLTGKAQDKWPFFDRNWKTMSSTVVKNLSIGEFPSSTKPSDTNGEVRHASAVQRPGSHPYEVPESMKLQVPFGKKQPRKRNSKSPFASQPKHSPVPLPSGKQGQPGETHQAERQPASQAQSGASTPQKYPHSASLSFNEDTLMTDEDVHTLPSPATTDHLREASRGKARGANGRFYTKAKDSPVSQVSRQFTGSPKPVGRTDTKPGKASEISNTATSDEGSNSDIEKDSAGELEATNGKVDVSMSDPEYTLPDAVPDGLSDSHGRAASQPVTSTHVTDPMPVDPMPFSILAAEAEAVPSNLDRLPPGSWRRQKRKSEPVAQRGQNKRHRGARGGVVGRPHRSEQPSAFPGQEKFALETEVTSADNNIEPTSLSPPPSASPSVSASRPAATPPPRMSTRQTTRKSVAATVSDTTPPKRSTTADMNDQNKQNMTNGETETSTNLVEDVDTSFEASITEPVASPVTKPPVKKTLGRPRKTADPGPIASVTPSAKKISEKTSTSKKQKSTPTAQQSKAKQSPTANGTKSRATARTTSIKALRDTSETLKSGDAATPTPGTVEFFARIHSRAGSSELPLPDDYLSADAEIVRRYAAWQEEEGDTSVSFAVFKKIFAFVAAPTS